MANTSRSTTADRPRRTLVLCFDGTSDEYSDSNTNVVKIFSTLDKNKPGLQLCYYQAGVGTYFKPGVVSPLWGWLAKIADQAVAWYLDEHVMQGYTFLMQNYRDGDKICIFGFSRGAYTARALAGMLYKVGLLGRDNPEQVPFAYKVYKRSDDNGAVLAAGFKRTFARDVKVEFLGVFDTVSSVGVLVKKNLPFTAANSAVKTFRHALSLDERRAKFQPNLYHRPSPNPAKDPQHASQVVPHVSYFKRLGREMMAEGANIKKRLSFKRSPRTSSLSSDHSDMSKDEAPADVGLSEDAELDVTDVKEVWFSGCHADVGGGCVTDSVSLSLAQITLHWMLREVVASQCGIIFDNEALQRLDFNYNQFIVAQLQLQPQPQPIEANQDPLDAETPLHDQLTIKAAGWGAPMWWILELMPLEFSNQDGRGVWHTYWSIHLGRGRKIPDIGPKFHVSVGDRMKNLKYRPNAQWVSGTEQYVK
ncbi:hypothetical protein FIBSPDRAFT_1045887 [Athelia psychrophila]|uniref:T6SS Phospholipase effector Tle1-like catalytic domain-containing protein n=1 Tax=Athelia psychrophila TaxID=1759441 RepID=A0A166HKH0_9AGAM|nr:hypothetical protein FIBSPDRAFT_1045887 [Fibularhizoctonia sp. CBS 109695]